MMVQNQLPGTLLLQCQYRYVYLVTTVLIAYRQQQYQVLVSAVCELTIVLLLYYYGSLSCWSLVNCLFQHNRYWQFSRTWYQIWLYQVPGTRYNTWYLVRGSQQPQLVLVRRLVQANNFILLAPPQATFVCSQSVHANVSLSRVPVQYWYAVRLDQRSRLNDVTTLVRTICTAIIYRIQQKFSPPEEETYSSIAAYEALTSCSAQINCSQWKFMKDGRSTSNTSDCLLLCCTTIYYYRYHSLLASCWYFIEPFRQLATCLTSCIVVNCSKLVGIVSSARSSHVHTSTRKNVQNFCQNQEL